MVQDPRSAMYATQRVHAASSTTPASETFATVFELGRKSCAIRKFENAPIGDYKRVELENIRFDKNSSGVGVRNSFAKTYETYLCLNGMF